MITKLRASSHSLPVRIAFLLAIALLPIGLISINQTYLLLEEAESGERSNLLAVTAEAAGREASSIRLAFGAARGLAAAVPALRRDGYGCGEELRAFVDFDPSITFYGYVDADGVVQCASTGEGGNFSDYPVFQTMLADPVARVILLRNPPLSQMPVLVVTVPVMTPEGAFDGYVGVSLMQRQFFTGSLQPAEQRRIDLVVFNSDSQILTTNQREDGSRQDMPDHLPSGRTLADLASGGRSVFLDDSRSGNPRIFAVVPIIEDTVYALGSWPYERRTVVNNGLNLTSSILFPVAMWLAGLGVAFYSMQSMVIKPTRNLRARMLMFMRSRRILPPKNATAVPREIVEMEETWQLMAESILRDEEHLKDTIQQKSVLLKEVHHRVKNNLQLVASILNMKIRKARTGEAKTALTDIQQRVMSIARVHQKLYETSAEERVRADELLEQLVDQIIAAAMLPAESVEVTQDFAPIVLFPDQAVPLSLAMSELTTNALKYMGAPKGKAALLSFSLEQIEDTETARLVVCNSLPPEGGEQPGADMPESGLGTKLIRAFAVQIEGEVVEEARDDQFCVTITFPIAEFQEDV